MDPAGARRRAAGHPLHVGAARAAATARGTTACPTTCPPSPTTGSASAPSRSSSRRRRLEGLLGPERHDLGAHDVADQELALELLLAERRQREHLAAAIAPPAAPSATSGRASARANAATVWR